MESNGLNEIENFYIAYKERLNEYIFIEEKSSDNEFRILLMHIGGIILECYIKSIIVEKKSIVKCKGNSGKHWYDEEKINSIEGLLQNEKSKALKEPTMLNPGHNIEKAIESIDQSLKEILASKDDIKEDIKIVQNPFRDQRSYIDLRYSATVDSNLVNNIFLEWRKSFKRLYKWIRETIKILEE